MSAPAGFALCAWSEAEGCWVSIAVSDDRARIAGLCERLSWFFSELNVCLLEAASCSDDDIVAASLDLKPPFSAGFVRPEACH